MFSAPPPKKTFSAFCSKTNLVTNLDDPVAILYDVCSQSLIWLDKGTLLIQAVKLDSSGFATIEAPYTVLDLTSLSIAPISPFGFSLDPFHRRLYWTDTSRRAVYFGTLSVAGTNLHITDGAIFSSLGFPANPLHIVSDSIRGRVLLIDSGFKSLLEIITPEGQEANIGVQGSVRHLVSDLKDPVGIALAPFFFTLQFNSSAYIQDNLRSYMQPLGEVVEGSTVSILVRLRDVPITPIVIHLDFVLLQPRIASPGDVVGEYTMSTRTLELSDTTEIAFQVLIHNDDVFEVIKKKIEKSDEMTNG